MRLTAALMLLPMLLAACGREEPTTPADPAATPPSQAAADADTAGEDAPPPAVRTRSLRLEQAGWRFDVDAATGAEGTRIEALVRTATAGAAPRRLQLDVAGSLQEAFATDLDGDATPELLLWTGGEGSAAQGDLLGWRFTADGEAEALALPALDGDLAVGWRGRDQFGVQGDRLVRSFPLYRDEDDNATPSTGFVRVIRYALQDGRLVVEGGGLEPIDGTPQAEALAR